MGHRKRKSVAIVRQVALSATRPFLLSGIHFNAVYFCGGGGGELEPAGECGDGGDIPGGVAAEGRGL